MINPLLQAKHQFQRIFNRLSPQVVSQAIKRGQLLASWVEQPSFKEVNSYLENQRILIHSKLENKGITKDTLDNYQGKLEMIKSLREWINTSIVLGKKYEEQQSKARESESGKDA